MSANGTSSKFSFDWSSLLQGITLAASTGCFIFLWNVNSTIAVIQEKQVQEEKLRGVLQQDLNQVKLDVRDLRDRAIRTERLTEANLQLQKP